MEDFITRMPWFAGYSAVMVNVSDIYAMGGRPTAVVNALWSPGTDPSSAMLQGMASACARYGVPMVGGHSNHRSERPQLAVAICGHARRLLTSFDACPGDRLMMAVDLRGAWQEPFPYWNASTEAPAQRLRDDLELLEGRRKTPAGPRIGVDCFLLAVKHRSRWPRITGSEPCCSSIEARCPQARPCRRQRPASVMSAHPRPSPIGAGTPVLHMWIFGPEKADFSPKGMAHRLAPPTICFSGRIPDHCFYWIFSGFAALPTSNAV